MRLTQTKRKFFTGFPKQQITLKEMQHKHSLQFNPSDIISSSPFTSTLFDNEETIFISEILSVINESIQISIDNISDIKEEEDATCKVFKIMNKKPIVSKCRKYNGRIIPNNKRNFYSENYIQLTQNSTKGDTCSLESSKKQ